MRKATLYLDASIHKAIRMKAAETRQSMSDLVNDALIVLILGVGHRKEVYREWDDRTCGTWGRSKTRAPEACR